MEREERQGLEEEERLEASAGNEGTQGLREEETLGGRVKEGVGEREGGREPALGAHHTISCQADALTKESYNIFNTL